MYVYIHDFMHINIFFSHVDTYTILKLGFWKSRVATLETELGRMKDKMKNDVRQKAIQGLVFLTK